MMKVRYTGDYYKVSLKKGKIYTVLEEIDGAYVLKDETGEEYVFFPEDFEVVEE